MKLQLIFLLFASIATSYQQETCNVNETPRIGYDGYLSNINLSGDVLYLKFIHVIGQEYTNYIKTASLYHREEATPSIKDCLHPYLCFAQQATYYYFNTTTSCLPPCYRSIILDDHHTQSPDCIHNNAGPCLQERLLESNEILDQIYKNAQNRCYAHMNYDENSDQYYPKHHRNEL
jgi:hypothetical protein